MKKLLLLLILISINIKLYSATCTTTKIGNWSDPTVWSCGHIPSSNDVVVISHDVVLNQNYTSLNGLTINVGGSIKEDITPRTLQIGQSSGGSYPGISISDTLIVSFFAIMKSTNTINSTGYVKVKADFTSSNNGDLIVNGDMVVDGNWYLSNGNVNTSGSGTLLLVGCLDTSGGGQVSNITVSWCASNTSCANYATIVGSTECNVVLPVELISFTATCSDNNKVKLFWVTSTEMNNSHFFVERSGEDMLFSEIEKISGNGTTIINVGYSYLSESSGEEISYFRLRQVDFNGVSSYSKIIKSSCTDMTGVTIYPNPSVDGDFYISISDNSNEKILLVLTDILGKQIYEKLVVKRDGEVFHSKEINTKLTPGIYYIVASNEQSYIRKKIIVY